ncbi:MAG: hypothetical protein E6J43_02095 [Chloroflexi bacterium]|nr:MAG: hypothetical protein E6J43_02095 [Chloroflexota bacterium]
MGGPESTVTIMFTDLVDSTGLGDRLGDAAAQALRRAHDRILKQQFVRFGGRVVKGTGDGFMVAFSSARQGVECAAELQQAIEAQHREGRYPELLVRVGLHTGEPLTEGHDLLGSDVDLAARIEAEADGGQDLVSELTHLLTRHHEDLEFTSVGERSLKGFRAPVPLFEVRWPQEQGVRTGLTPFVGRRDEAAQLRRHLEAATHGQGALVLVGGGPGVGKTRLVSELAIYASDRGLDVLTGRAYGTEGMPPYLPFTEALKPWLRDRSPEQLRAAVDGNAAYLVRLLPELAQLLPDIPEAPALGPEAERYRLFEGVSDFLLTVASGKPLLLSLDDLHSADDASLLLLQHLARRLVDAPLLVIGTYRDTEVDPSHPLAGLLTELTRRRLGSRLSVQPLPRDEAALLAEAALGDVPAHHVADALFAATEGNPFFIEELVRHLQEQGRDLTDAQSKVSDWIVPEGIRQVIERRLWRLDEAARRVLVYSAVIGRDLSLPRLSAATALDEESALNLLEKALAAQLLREEGGGYAFAHPLIRETLYQGLSAPRRRHLHRRVAEAFEVLYLLDPEPHLAELAHHFFQAAQEAAADKAVLYASRAGERAGRLLAYEEATDHYERALQAMQLLEPSAETDDQLCALLLFLGENQWRSGNTPQALETFKRAAVVAKSLSNAEQLAIAALYFGGAGFVARVGVFDETLVGLLEDALIALGDADSPLRARVLARLSMAIHWSPQQDRRLALSQQALEMARRLGDPVTLAHVLISRHYSVGGPEAIEDRAAVYSEILRLAEQSRDKELALVGMALRIVNLVEIGDTAAADAEIEAFAALAEELRIPQHLWWAAIFRTMRTLMAGRFNEVETQAQDALILGQTSQIFDAAQTYGVQFGILRREQGRVEEIEPAFRGFVETYGSVPQWRIGLAYIYSSLGREEDARAQFEFMLSGGLDKIPEDLLWMGSISLLSEVCAFLGDAPRAAELYRLPRPHAGRCVVIANAVASYGSASRFLGLLATTMHRWEHAECHFEDALVMNARIDSPPWVAWTQYQYAQMLARRGDPVGRTQAGQLLTRALMTARELGMKLLEDLALGLEPELTEPRRISAES